MKKQKGSIIVFALIVLSFVLIAAFSVASVTLVERRSAGASVNSSTAFQNADKGMEEFLQKIYKELDQNDDLEDLADKLPGYSCSDGASSNKPATIGSEDTEFIISAYGERPNTNDAAGWERNSLVPLQSCDTSLADVARFKAAGNFNNAARAVFLKLRDSLTRGLVAKWSFEDRAQTARITPESDREERISWFAQDSSKRSHTLTLCPIRYDATSTPSKPEIRILREDNTTETYDIEEFSDCAYDNSTGMHPGRSYAKTAYGHTGSPEENDDDEYDVDGAWEEGHVEESIPSGANAHNDLSKEEALYFNGTDTFLAMYMKESCDSDHINCVEESDDRLDLDEGIAISLWVKRDDENGTGHLVSRMSGNNKGYRVYTEVNGKVCFAIDGDTHCSSNGDLDDSWHHVVVRWRDGDAMQIFVDGERKNAQLPHTGDIAATLGEPLYIGAQNGDPTDLFAGIIDDVRIWNRGLTNKEIFRLCKDGNQSHTCTEETTP